MGLSTKPYSIDGINWYSNNKLAVDKSGTYTIYVKDAVGNIATKKFDVVLIENDDNAKTEDEHPENTKDAIAPEINDIQVDGFKIKITATDNGAGLAEKAYSLDNKTWQSSNEITVEKDGQYMVYVRDKAGNVANKLVVVKDKKTTDGSNKNISNEDGETKTSTETTEVEKIIEDKTQAKTVIPQAGATLPVIILTVISITSFVGYKKFKKVNY